MTIVELENVSKSYGDKNVLNNLSFKIEEGTFNVIMGASGSGKSTIHPMPRYQLFLPFFSSSTISL